MGAIPRRPRSLLGGGDIIGLARRKADGATPRQCINPASTSIVPPRHAGRQENKERSDYVFRLSGISRIERAVAGTCHPLNRTQG